MDEDNVFAVSVAEAVRMVGGRSADLPAPGQSKDVETAAGMPATLYLGQGRTWLIRVHLTGDRPVQAILDAATGTPAPADGTLFPGSQVCRRIGGSVSTPSKTPSMF